MRKYTVIGEKNRIQKLAFEFLKMESENTEEILEENSKKFLNKHVLLLGSVNLPFLKEILQKVRTLVYIGNDEKIKETILEYVAEKDIPIKIDQQEMFSGTINVFYNNIKTIEIYSSFIYTELELICKYILQLSGTKVMLLAKYISQYFTNRTSEIFDHKRIDELEALYSNTMDYIDHMEENKEVLVKEDLIEIYQTYKPELCLKFNTLQSKVLISLVITTMKAKRNFTLSLKTKENIIIQMYQKKSLMHYLKKVLVLAKNYTQLLSIKKTLKKYGKITLWQKNN